MNIKAVQSSYARWAPIYDKTFGFLTGIGRRKAVDYINARPGKLLEVGVGTGLSLPNYTEDVDVWGVDYSEDMLEKAEQRVAKLNLKNIRSLCRMDAQNLDFPDNHFDTIAAMHVLSVVPNPEKVMSEIARVCKPGGQVVITNHFARSKGILAAVAKITAPMANFIGWHSDFELNRILGQEHLKLVNSHRIPPLGMMTFLVLEKSQLS